MTDMTKLCQFLLLAFVLYSTSSRAYSLIIATTDNPNTSLHVYALKQFKKLLESASSNQLQVRIHYRGHPTTPAIMGEEFNVRLLIKGESRIHQPMQMTVVAAGNLSHHANVFEFLMLPYLFESKTHAKKLFRNEEIMSKLNATLVSKHGIRALAWLIGDYRHLTNSKRPIETIADLKDLRIRTPVNALMHSTYEQLGARVVPLPWGETFESLRSLRVYGQENPYSVIADSKFWKAKQKYIANNGTFLWTGPILINENFYQNLSEDHKSLVQKSAQLAAESQWLWSETNKEKQIQILKENGIQFTELKDKHLWVKAAKSLWPEHYEKIGYGDKNSGKRIVDEVIAAMH